MFIKKKHAGSFKPK